MPACGRDFEEVAGEMLRSCGRLLARVALACVFAGGACAQNYPVKVVRYIVPMSPGSGADTLGRIVTAGLTQVLGQQVIIDNRTGAAANIGAEAAAKAPPDGYTLFQASSTLAANVSLYRHLAYDGARFRTCDAACLFTFDCRGSSFAAG